MNTVVLPLVGALQAIGKGSSTAGQQAGPKQGQSQDCLNQSMEARVSLGAASGLERLSLSGNKCKSQHPASNLAGGVCSVNIKTHGQISMQNHVKEGFSSYNSFALTALL